MNYITINQAALKCSISPRRLQQLCKSGEIDGAVMHGRRWMLPEDFQITTATRQRKQNALLPLPVGISGYIETVTNYYYVDKTLMIKDLIDSLPKVSLFTRPRRFGKTLNMDMLRVFFEKSETDTSVYFKDKTIWKCGDHYRSYQGKYPVIYLSFKDVKYSEWSNALKDIADIIAAEYARHSELADSESCSDFEKNYYRQIVEGSADEVRLARSLAVLSNMLNKHFGTDAVIIIDEYDTPIQQGYSCGYYDEVVGFIRNLFSGAFKDNQSLAFGFLTGILRVAKESIFSGLNNLKVNTVTDERYSSYFGFTRDEVRQMLRYYQREDRFDEVCEWYDGYCFGSSDIFNPWSVINYIDDRCTPKAFWQSTGSNEIIGDILSSATPEITENLRRLMQGGSVTTYIDTNVIYPEISRDPSSIYSFLLMAGYLKTVEMTPQADGNYMSEVSVPNKEIAFVYSKEIIAKLDYSGGVSTATEIQQAIFERNTDKIKNSIEKYLIQTISYFDAANEAFYQGLMIGLCAIMNNRYYVSSNRESGLGRFDLQLMPMDKTLPAFIFELKASRNMSDDLDTLASFALEQIKEKKYAEDMRGRGVGEIICVGIAFRGKEISVADNT